MDRIQDKVVAKILGYVPRKDQMKLFLVSKRWYKTMDEFVGIDALLGYGDQYEIFDRKLRFDSLKTIANFGVRSILLRKFVNGSMVLPKLKHPDLLRFIVFHDFVSTRTFESILHGVTNLHTLKIDQAALFHLELMDIKICLPCQVLEVNWDYGEQCLRSIFINADFNYSEVISLNVRLLLRTSSFPGLKVLRLYLCTLEPLYTNITTEIAQFINKQSEFLTTVEISIHYNSWISKYNLTSTHPEPRISEDRQFKKLRTIQVFDSSDLSLDHWMSWASRVKNLEEIKFNFPSTNLLETIVENSGSTLTSIIIPNTFTRLFLFDCRSLQNCQRLNNLEIWGDWISTEEKFPIGLLNAHFLPKTLINLHIRGLRITNEGCRTICLDLPNLENLELGRIAEENGFGVPVDVAREVLSRKQIKKFKVQVGSAGTEDDPYKHLLDIAYKYSDKYLACTLGENGEYSLSSS